MTGYGDATVIDLEPEADPKREGSVYEPALRLFVQAFFDQTAKPMASSLGESPPSPIKRGFGRRGHHITFNTYDFVVRESVVSAAGAFPAVFIGRKVQTVPNRSFISEAPAVDASTEVDPAFERQSRVVEKLTALARLPAGWDGLDAPAADHGAIDRALTLIVGLGERARLQGVTLPEPAVGPAGLGSVQLEWQGGSRFLAVEVPVPSEPLSFFAALDGEEILSDEALPEHIWAVVTAMADSEP